MKSKVGITNLDNLNLVKPCYGGLILSLSQFSLQSQLLFFFARLLIESGRVEKVLPK